MIYVHKSPEKSFFKKTFLEPVDTVYRNNLAHFQEKITIWWLLLSFFVLVKIAIWVQFGKKKLITDPIESLISNSVKSVRFPITFSLNITLHQKFQKIWPGLPPIALILNIYSIRVADNKIHFREVLFSINFTQLFKIYGNTDCLFCFDAVLFMSLLHWFTCTLSYIL